MQAIAFWEAAGLSLERANPYAGLLARALESYGVHSIAGFAENLTPAWLKQNRGTYEVLHLHWPWGLYQADDLERAVAKCAALVDSLLLARSLGYKVVWTMHNLYPHDSSTHDLDHLARLAITSCASAVIAHCDHARTLLSHHFHRERGVFMIPHGHFSDAYPNTVARAEARQSFGFEDHHFVYLFFGTLRSNKGVEQLLDAFLTMDGADLRLLFAARVCSEYGERLVERARQADPRIVLRESAFFKHDELQWFYNAADVAVFPFTDILTSGSAITALSFRCPVIVPAIGCLPQAVDQTVGAVYDAASSEGFRRALEQAQSIRREHMQPAIEQRLRELSWERIAQTTLEAYRF